MRRVMMMAAAAVALAGAAPARADPVTDWWDAANRYWLAGQGAPGPRTPDMDRASTRAALAMFEAVNAIDRRYESYLKLPAGDPAASQDAAAATAAYLVLLKHYPANKAALDDSYAWAMSQVANDKAREAGRRIGEQAAQAAMDANGIDPAIEQTPYRPRTAVGEWIGAALPTLEPHNLALKPWAAPNVEALMVGPPPPATSDRYAQSYEEIRRLGSRSSKERTPLQTIIAKYRQGFDLAPTIRLITDQPGRTQVQNARLIALYQMAFDDAAQAMVVAKLRYNYWRPITAIRNGDKDNNAATQPDPNWMALLPTPNFPEYPCGHCTVAAVEAEILKTEGGLKPGTPIRVASLGNPMAVTQTAQSWDDFVQQVSDSRMLGGVHFRFANEAGEEIGRKAARMAIANVLRPLPPKRKR